MRREARAKHIQVYIAMAPYTDFYSKKLVDLILDDAFDSDIHT